MKMKKALVILALIVASFNISNAQSKNTETVSFKTSAKCGMCKSRLEKDLSLTKGVKEAKLNLDDKVMTITYNTKKTNAKELQGVIANIGYDANELIAVQKSHDALPKCCQKTAEAHVD